MRALVFAIGVAIAATTALSAGCAGPSLDRLQGEPKSTWPFTTSPDEREKPVVAGIKRFLKAAKAGRNDLVYRQLSTLTKRALKQRAQAIGVGAAQLLNPPASGAGPGAVKVHIADPLATFALRGTVTITAGPDPYPPEQPADGRTIEQVVTLKAADGRSRTLTMRFEGLHWRVHNPTLSSSGRRGEPADGSVAGTPSPQAE